MILLYRIGILAYAIAAKLAAVFNTKARKFVTGRQDLLQTIKAAHIGVHNPIWIHCSSLGEFEQARSVIDELHKKGEKILLTFFSPSGYEVRRDYPAVDWVFYLPMDTAQNATKFIAYTKPKKAIFVKYDLWYFHLAQLQTKGIPSYLISAHYQSNQVYFKPLRGRLHRQMLGMFEHIYLQDQNSKNLLLNIGIDRTSVVGDTRVDSVLLRAKNAVDLPLIESFLKGKKAIVLGSAYASEVEILKACLEEFKDEKIIIAPHEIDSQNIQRLQAKLDQNSIRYSKLSNTEEESDILFIDNIGKLFDIYAHAKMVFIGGGFETGLHNTLEPAAFGLPICFGPKYHKFVEAVEMVQLGCAYPINSANDLKKLYSQVNNEPQRISIKQKVGTYMRNSQGATQHILKELSS